MLFQSSSIVLLTALSFLSRVSTSVTGHARSHHHLRRSPVAFGDDTLSGSKTPRSSAGSIDVPVSELHVLQSETNAFQQWMDTWLDAETATDASPAIALLRQEIQAYESWINAWLDSAMSVGGAPPPPLPSSIPVTLPAGSSPVLPRSPSDSAAAASSTSAGAISSPATSDPPAAQQLFQVPTTSTQAGSNNTDYNFPAPTSFVTLASQQPTGPLASSSLTVSVDVGPSASPLPSSRAGPSPGSGQFDAQSSNNVAVYYGQTDAAGRVSLGAMCQDENVDIVILAFLNIFFSDGGFPAVNFGAACGQQQTPQMVSAGATGLLSCPDMASQIQQCQGLGKKVLLSLGGSNAVSAFADESKATGFANQLWDLFGAGTGVDPGLRPFGDVKIDGFDVGKSSYLSRGA